MTFAKYSTLVLGFFFSVVATASNQQSCTSTARDLLILDFDLGEATFNGTSLALKTQNPQNGATLDVLLVPSAKSPRNYEYTFHVQQWQATRPDGYTTLARQSLGRDLAPALSLTCVPL